MTNIYPNLFIIGAAKAGTSALHFYLSLHPEVHMSRIKEPHYFSQISDRLSQLASTSDPAVYQGLFSSTLPIRGESSVSYSLHPHPAGVPARIHAVAPDAKIIYLVRDPVERFVSHYRMSTVYGQELRTLSEVVFRPAGVEELRCEAASRYATQVSQYLEYFDSERILVVDQSDLHEQRVRTLRRILSFLEVDPGFTSPYYEVPVNRSADIRRFNGLGALISGSRTYQAAAARMRPDVRRRLVNPVRTFMSKPNVEVSVAPEIRDELKQRFAPEAESLRKMTGQAFRTWTV